MRRLRRWGMVVLVAAVVCTLLVTRDWSKKSVWGANRFLSRLEFVPLPEGVTEVRCKWSGIFAKYVNVKFAASREQALAYLKANAVPHYTEFRATDGGYEVCETHVLTTSPGRELRDVPVRLGHRNMYRRKWFESVYGIRHGWFYSYEDFPVLYEMYYDLDAGQFYIYWTYS